MKKYCYHTLLFLPVFFTAAIVQAFDRQPQIEWDKTFENVIHIYSIDLTNDSGYILSALGNLYFEEDSSTSNTHWVGKLDEKGKIEWQKFLKNGFTWYTSNSVKQTHDGGYIFAASPAVGLELVDDKYARATIWIIKLDSDGNIQWERLLGAVSGSGTHTLIRPVMAVILLPVSGGLHRGSPILF